MKPLVFLLVVFSVACNSTAQTSSNVTVAAFEKAINQPGIQLLDVRTMKEYQGGYLKNAMQADWTIDTEFKERVAAMDKSKPVYIYCLSGARSNAATQWLNKNGFTAYNLAGGIAAWKREDKPVIVMNEVSQMSMQQYLQKIDLNKTVLVDIGATWCPPCKKMKPVIDSIASANEGKLQVIQIDGGEQSELTKAMNIISFPTFIIYKNGKETWRKNGMVEASEIVSQF